MAPLVIRVLEGVKCERREKSGFQQKGALLVRIIGGSDFKGLQSEDIIVILEMKYEQRKNAAPIKRKAF